MCEKTCSKIVGGGSALASYGVDYAIKDNKKVWYTEDGTCWGDVNDYPQYRGPIGRTTYDGRICRDGGYKGGGLGGIFGY